jgi:hypothetical protein
MNSGDTSDAWLIIKGIPVRNLGKVEHHIFPEALTIVNTTLKGHALDPGNVFRRIVQDGDNIYVETTGYGIGSYREPNEKYAPDAWKSLDEDMRDRLNSLSVPTYRDAFASTNATDIAEAGGNVYDAVRANQADLANAYHIYNQYLFNNSIPESNWP